MEMSLAAYATRTLSIRWFMPLGRAGRKERSRPVVRSAYLSAKVLVRGPFSVSPLYQTNGPSPCCRASKSGLRRRLDDDLHRGHDAGPEHRVRALDHALFEVSQLRRPLRRVDRHDAH